MKGKQQEENMEKVKIKRKRVKKGWIDDEGRWGGGAEER